MLKEKGEKFLHIRDIYKLKRPDFKDWMNKDNGQSVKCVWVDKESVSKQINR